MLRFRSKSTFPKSYVESELEVVLIGTALLVPVLSPTSVMEPTLLSALGCGHESEGRDFGAEVADGRWDVDPLSERRCHRGEEVEGREAD
jgi:hypothetical protein